jgi:hypothetical protein
MSENYQVELSEELKRFATRYDDQPGLQVAEDLTLLRSLLNWAQEEAAGILTTAEALLLCEALVKTVMPPLTHQRLDQTIKEAVRQALEREGLAAKREVNPHSLMLKLSRLTMPQALAIWHWVKTFWTNPHWDHQKVAELFRTKD